VVQVSFDIHVAMSRIREAVRDHPKAAMFELSELGFGSVFHQLVACMLSIRTKDETAMPAALAMFARAPTAKDLAEIPLEDLDLIIGKCAFHLAKAEQIKEIAQATVDRFGGELPGDFDVLTSFRGVGPKCANLALGVACGHGVIAVDVHVHRICNRWGYVSTSTPEGTMEALYQVLPEEYRIEINALLVPFGKNICTGISPWCSRCPLVDMCARVGVTKSR